MDDRDVWDSREFYELMQSYRHAGAIRGGNEADVVPAFEAVKAYCREVVEDVISCRDAPTVSEERK